MKSNKREKVFLCNGILAIGVAYLLFLSPIALAIEWIAKPEVAKIEDDDSVFGDRWMVSFELADYRDVEVAIIDTSTFSVVRHLAAGMLGEAPPPPLIANSLHQQLLWDGLDDYGEWIAKSDELALRVRVGTSVRMDKIVGGDPYGWFSVENAINDHVAWGMNQAIDAKSDGRVFIYGNAGTLGAPTIRQYDAEGNFTRTVFPFPAGHDIVDVEGWGVRVKDDGTYAPVFSRFRFEPTITNSYVVSPYMAFLSTLISNPNDTNQLTVMTNKWWDEGQTEGKLLLQSFNTDGSISLNSKSGRVISSPALPESSRLIEGEFFTAYSNNGNYLFISSLYHANEYGNVENFYHEGQVFKVDVATGIATSFYDQGPEVPGGISVSREGGFSQLHGITVDGDDNVFVCDRQNDRIVVLSSEGNILQTIPVSEPDNVAVSAAGAMYVTARGMTGSVYLHKFDDWVTSDIASDTVVISEVIPVMAGLTDVAVAENEGDPRIWVSYPSAPVKIFSDGPSGLVLEKDFNEINAQRNLGINSIAVDSKTETLFVDDAFGTLFKVDNWDSPVFERCLIDENTELYAGSMAIDERNRFLYTRGEARWNGGPIKRWDLDSDGYYTPLGTEAGSNAVTTSIVYGWYIRTGMTDKGFDVAPDGSLVVSGGIGGEDYPSFLKYFNRDETISPWGSLVLDARKFSGAKVDFEGNIYAALYDGPPTSIPAGYESDPFYLTDQWNPLVSRIYKFAPTGTIESGDLYPYAPVSEVKIYDVPYGMTGREQASTFGLDGYGRIVYPTAISQNVTLIDNAGNMILNFGTYGNSDSRGGLPGELVPTSGVPMAYGHTVDISDNYIYVGDLNNNRILRLALSHDLVEQLTISVRPDIDQDGISDNADPDIDGDGIVNEDDEYPNISLDGRLDTDNDGRPNDCDAACINLGMLADLDDDGDGFIDDADNCPLDSNADQANGDGDDLGDVCDPTVGPDADHDLVIDSLDNCRAIPNPGQELAIGSTDCGIACVITSYCGAPVCSNP